MLDKLLEILKKFFKSRLLPISIVYILLFAILIHRIFSLQIVQGVTITEEGARKQERELETKATRGNIYDCNGVLLAYNELSYNVTYEDTGALENNSDKNAMIYKMIKIIESHGGELSTENYFKLEDTGEIGYTIDGDAITQFKKEVFSATIDDLTEKQLSMSAEELFEFICYSGDVSGPNFEIDKKYPVEYALKIMSVRFAIFLNRYSKYEKLIIATNVDDITVAAIKENRAELPGVDISQDTTRVYNDSKYFAHILGYTGPITTEKLEELKKEDPKTQYNVTDQIGIMGIENEYEEYLRGTKGSQTVMINENYRVVETKDFTEPVAGSDIYLTIDSQLQKACYDILERRLAGILISKINNGRDAGTRGQSAQDIRVPIYDVYNALLTNNVLDLNHFQNAEASTLEKRTYKKFKNKRSRVTDEIRRVMGVNSTKTDSDLSDEMIDYLDYAYSVLKEKKVVMVEKVDETDTTFISFTKNKVSLSKYLQHAIDNQWVDLNKLGIEYGLMTTEEIYGTLLDYVLNSLKKDTKFTKMIYSDLVYSDELTGNEICMLLYDQGILKYKKSSYNSLKNGVTNAYDFIISKIRSLEITPGQLALDPCSGSIVVTDVNSGKVKAMVSYPSYDNNKMANKVDSDYYYSYIDGNASYPAMNRPTQQVTAPGSTFKMVTATAALEEGYVSIGDTIKDKVTFKAISPSPHCWSSVSHGNINVAQAIEMSCNYFFYEIGYEMGNGNKKYVNDKKGLSILKKYAKMYGLLDKSGVELPEVEPNYSTKDIVRSAIGQGSHNYTPAQLSRYVTTIANNGTCYDLTLIQSVKDINGKTILKNKANVHNKVELDISTWNAIHTGMYNVVNGKDSTIGDLFDQKKLKQKVAGKTGTPQESDYKANHAAFVSYAPYNNPDISVTCVIPNGHTSSNAAETARDVYKYYFSKDKKIPTKVTAPELDSASFSD